MLLKLNFLSHCDTAIPKVVIQSKVISVTKLLLSILSLPLLHHISLLLTLYLYIVNFFTVYPALSYQLANLLISALWDQSYSHFTMKATVAPTVTYLVCSYAVTK